MDSNLRHIRELKQQFCLFTQDIVQTQQVACCPTSQLDKAAIAARVNRLVDGLGLFNPDLSRRAGRRSIESMAVRRILQLGDPVLRARCVPVANPRSPAARIVADDLRDTLRDMREKHGSGRGLAAPQIGAPIRMVHVELPNRRWTLVNPEIVDVGDQDFLVWDDCFSFPDLFVRVQRAYHVTVRYQDRTGITRTLEAEGPLAELIQHEIDHLDGVLAVDRATGIDPFCLREEWAKHWAAQGRFGSPMPREEPRGAHVL
jgi:peptide deformylase